MATATYLTSDMLEELVWALEITLSKVSYDELEISNAEEAELWRTAKNWLDEANEVLQQPDEARYLKRLSKFPLNGAQLRRLQQAADRIAAEREQNKSSLFHRLMNRPVLTKRGLVAQSWLHAHRSSGPIAIVLGISLAVTVVLTVLDSTVWRNIPWQLLAGADVAMTLFALGVWVLHHLDLNQHHDALAELRVVEPRI